MAGEASLVTWFKRAVRDLGVALAQRFGTRLHDAETGQPLGRVLLIPWGGKIHVIGTVPEFSVRVQFLHQTRLTYWKQEIGFTATPVPDFPHEAQSAPWHPAGRAAGTIDPTDA